MSIINDKGIEKISEEIEKTPIIVVDGKNYKEITNVLYRIPYRVDNLKVIEAPPTEEDEKERNYLLSRIDDCIKILKKDKNSRRAVFSNIYENKLCKCICLVHLYIRNDMLNIFEYYRSQDIEHNFMYDYITSIMLMKKASDALSINPGLITVRVMSLHKHV
jgi:thymidylate synthase